MHIRGIILLGKSYVVNTMRNKVYHASLLRSHKFERSDTENMTSNNLHT